MFTRFSSREICSSSQEPFSKTTEIPLSDIDVSIPVQRRLDKVGKLVNAVLKLSKH